MSLGKSHKLYFPGLTQPHVDCKGDLGGRIVDTATDLAATSLQRSGLVARGVTEAVAQAAGGEAKQRG